MTESHNNAVNSLIDRVANLGFIPGNETEEIIYYIMDFWNPMGQIRDAESEVASSEFIDSLDCFTNFRSKMVDNLPSYTGEVQELLKSFSNEKKEEVVEHFLIQHYGIGTQEKPYEYICLSKMRQEVFRKMEADLENCPEVFSEPFLEFPKLFKIERLELP